jgi:predicted DNA-binding protein
MGTVLKTVKLPADLAAALARKAKARGLTESDLIREGIEQVTADVDGLDMQAVIGADVGSGNGPGDLSTNRKRLSGYGRTRAR